MRIKFPNSYTVKCQSANTKPFLSTFGIKKTFKRQIYRYMLFEKKITFVERSTLKTVDVWPEQKLENRMGILFFAFLNF